MRLALGICIVACIPSMAGPASAKPPSPAKPIGPVAIAYPAALRNELDHLPRLVPNQAVTAAVATKINAALQREDARGNAAAAECRQSFQEMQHKTPKDAWTRSIAVTMAGPHYLGIVVSDSNYCGGAYPNDGMRSDFVYDLTTGRPVDWVKLFPAGAKGKLENSADGAVTGLVAWPGLTERAKAQADGDCRDVFDEDEYSSFSIGLDAQRGALVAEPAELHHVIQACADDIRLSVADLRKLGFAPELVAALDAASRYPRR